MAMEEETKMTTLMMQADDNSGCSCSAESPEPIMSRQGPLHNESTFCTPARRRGEECVQIIATNPRRRSRRPLHPSKTMKSRLSSSLMVIASYQYCLFSAPNSVADATTATASNSNTSSSTSNNLRQQRKEQQQQQQQQSTTKSKCIGQWYISIEHPSSCTNSGESFPKEWADPSVRAFIFHNTPQECCKDVLSVADACNVINACDDDGSGNGSYQIDKNTAKQQQQTINHIFHGTSPSCELTTWHMSTEVLYACTNDENYPRVWNEMEVERFRTEKRGGNGGRQYLFTSASACCAYSYPLQECDVMDACPTPPPTPAPSPKPSRTRKPGPPTQKPSPPPTPKPSMEPTSYPTGEPPDWYVDRKNSQCVMDCIDEPRRPCGGKKSPWETSFQSVTACCESINWIPVENCITTASPIQSPTDPPKNEQGDNVNRPTGSPTKYFNWYLEQSTNRCVQECKNQEGYACGYKSPSKWQTRYTTVEECCAAIPWKPFDQCRSTAAPVTATPTTSTPPTMTPSPSMLAEMLDATPQPTKRSERINTPSSSPTQKPTADCPAPHWFLFRQGAQTKCINDSSYTHDIVNQNVKQYLIFDTAEECCKSPLANQDYCQIDDVCSASPSIIWFADYSRGWDDGVCISTATAPFIPKGRKTFKSQLDCCLGGFLGQSSEACLSFLSL